MKQHIAAITFLAFACPASALEAAAPDAELSEIVVTAGWRNAAATDVPASVSVLQTRTIQDAGVQHLEELLPLVPNLNWSGGSSRPRYFQLRGVGELDQYQGAPNPSVGFLIDDIDFSGVGMPATLFDVKQIEVLRGPQGTRYGANALAGLISIASADPTPDWQFRAEANWGDDNERGAGAVLSGPLAGRDDLAFRISGQRMRSDGFRYNSFLRRHDTNGRDESSVRGKLRWRREDLEVKLTALYVDLDNGYDEFAIDNSLTTLSDEPGKDSQRSTAGSMRVNWHADRRFELVSTTAAANSNIVASYDGDWGNDQSWGALGPYEFFSETLRERRTVSQDLRLMSTPDGRMGRFNWVVGTYLLRLQESNDQHDHGIYFGASEFALASRYRATNIATYGELQGEIAPSWHLTLGLRSEQRDAHYVDSDASDFDPRDRMVGGQIALSRALGHDRRAYLSLSRGYKAGGFNIGLAVPADRRQYDPEYLWNAEIGFKGSWLDGRLSGGTSLFYMLRRSQQVSTSFQIDPTNPLAFGYLTDNAARGVNYGLESSWQWRIAAPLHAEATLGLLRTRYQDYVYGERILSGRDQAHAPRYDFSLALLYRHPAGWYARADWSGKDSFYFDASNDERSQAYELLNLRVGCAVGNWSADLWMHNVFDRRYAVRGFFFGDEPPDFPNRLYLRWGDPRQFGVKLAYRFGQ
jgi:iron complex outermembrane recepter protein